MEEIRTSDTITFSLDTDDGATNSILAFPRGQLASDGSKASWFAAQITADYTLKLYRVNDHRGNSIEYKHKTFSLDNQFEKLDTLQYCARLTSDSICNIFQQTGSPKLWVYVEFNWSNGNVKRELNLNHPGDASYIDFFSKYKNHLYYRVIDASGDWYLYYLDLDKQPKKGTIVAPDFTYAITADMADFVVGKDFIYLYTDDSGDPVLYKIAANDSTMTAVKTITDPLAGDIFYQYPVSLHIINEKTDTLFIRKRNSTLLKIEDDVATRLNNNLPVDATPYFRIQTLGNLYVEAESITITANEEDSWEDTWYTESVVPLESEPLDDVVTNLCERVGLSSSDIDVTSLAGIDVDGYVIETITDQWSNFEALRMAYFFDIIDGADNVTFALRGQAAAGAIDPADLGAYIGDAKYSQLLDHQQESSQTLPAKVIVKHKNQSLDYQDDAQIFQSVLAENKEVVEINLSSLAITPDFAKQIAHIIYNVKQSELDRYTFPLTVNNFKYLPGDNVTLSLNDIDYVFRLLSVMYYPTMLLDFQAVLEDVDNYTSNFRGAVGDDEEGTIELLEDTVLEVLDIPLLLPSHNTDGFVPIYLAAGPVVDGLWEGAYVKRTQNFINYDDIDFVPNQSIIGYAITALADGSVSVIDYGSSVTVQLYDTSQTLATVSEANLLTLQYNLALLGHEIIAFMTVTDNGDGNYTLSGMLRGLFGTEHYTDTHTSQDRFVLLDTDNLVVYNDLLANLDAQFYFVGITDGKDWNQDDDDFEVTSLLLSGQAITPFAVTSVTADLQTNDDIVFRFERRDRLPLAGWNCWLDYRDLKLSDTDEWEMDIYDGDTIVRTISGTFSGTEAETTYTSAQQTADGFSPPVSSIKAYIYQISNLDDRGIVYELEKSF